MLCNWKLILRYLVSFWKIRIEIVLARKSAFIVISQFVARAILRLYSTTFLLSTGSTPGMPRQTGQVWVFGGAPKAVEHPQKIFVLSLTGHELQAL